MAYATYTRKWPTRITSAAASSRRLIVNSRLRRTRGQEDRAASVMGSVWCAADRQQGEAQQRYSHHQAQCDLLCRADAAFAPGIENINSDDRQEAQCAPGHHQHPQLAFGQRLIKHGAKVYHRLFVRKGAALVGILCGI